MDDTDPTARALRLLALLQARRAWTPRELADRLGVSTRTLRRDLARLASLDYRVESRPGPGGYYALVAGGRVPPLAFDDDEVLAIVAGLRMVQDVTADDSADRALAKLRQVLPRRLAAVAGTVIERTRTVPRSAPSVDLGVVGALARAAAEERSVAFDYEDAAGRRSSRRVDSAVCLHSRGQWYVVAFDLDRDDWRIFRADRVSALRTGPRAARREGPLDDLTTWLTTDLGRLPAGPDDRP